MNPKIIFVDDDPNLLAAFQRNLHNKFSFDCAGSGAEALEAFKTRGPYALALVDMNMPGMKGIELLEKMQAISPDTVRMMLTGNADQQTAVDAVNQGQVYRFLNKPCPPEVLVPALEDGLKRFEILRMEKELLEGTLMGSVKLLSEVLGMAAPEALGRGQRLRESMRVFAQYINAVPTWELEVAALLSSIGCASLPANLLEKMSSGEERTLAEEQIIQRVPQIGHDLLARIPRLENVARMILFQKKGFDGSAYPAITCVGENLPAGARMLKILDDRMSLESEGIVKLRAFQTMESRKGIYDPRLLQLCFACFKDFMTSAVSGELPVRSLFIKELVENQVVVSDITSLAGRTLLGAGNRLTPMLLQRLHNYDALGEVKQPVLVQDPAPTVEAA